MFAIYYLTWKAVDFVFGIYGNRYLKNDEILWDIIKKKKNEINYYKSLYSIRCWLKRKNYNL